MLFALPNENTTTPKLENATDDHKTTWKLLNEVINKHKSRSSLLTSFKSDGTALTDPMKIAYKLFKYFTNIGPNLARFIPSKNLCFLSYFEDNNHPSIKWKFTATN